VEIAIALLSHEQRDDVTAAAKGFTCRGRLHVDDETVVHGDKYLCDALWADFDASGITRTWIAVVDGTVGGYIALAADAVHLSKGERRDADLEGVHFTRYGCTQVVMIAVRADLHGTGVGRSLMDHAKLVGSEAGVRIGARFLAADVNPPAQGFYEKCGFKSLASDVEELKNKRERGLIPMVFDLRPRA
jgi:GNAT superfamily N-acetyltransferase